MNCKVNAMKQKYVKHELKEKISYCEVQFKL